jgi:hypothetical protein
MAEETPKVTFNGSCHCKSITYTVKMPAVGTTTRCNCTICHKTGYSGLMVQPEDFTLLTPGSLEDLPDYVWRNKEGHRHFCDKCGVQILAHGSYTIPGPTPKKVDFFSVNLRTLDQPQEGLDLRKWKVIYMNGRDDDFMHPQSEPHENGCV